MIKKNKILLCYKLFGIFNIILYIYIKFIMNNFFQRKNNEIDKHLIYETF